MPSLLSAAAPSFEPLNTNIGSLAHSEVDVSPETVIVSPNLTAVPSPLSATAPSFQPLTTKMGSLSLSEGDVSPETPTETPIKVWARTVVREYLLEHLPIYQELTSLKGQVSAPLPSPLHLTHSSKLTRPPTPGLGGSRRGYLVPKPAIPRRQREPQDQDGLLQTHAGHRPRTRPRHLGPHDPTAHGLSPISVVPSRHPRPVHGPRRLHPRRPHTESRGPGARHQPAPRPGRPRDAAQQEVVVDEPSISDLRLFPRHHTAGR